MEKLPLLTPTSTVTLSNTILWDNSATNGGNEIFIEDDSCSVVLKYCCVDNTGYGFGSGVPTTTIDDSNHCIFVDPQFVDADGADNTAGTDDDDLHLQDTSPCMDAGNNSYVPSGVTTDLDGNPRIVNSTVDIGAYEKQ